MTSVMTRPQDYLRNRVLVNNFKPKHYTLSGYVAEIETIDLRVYIKHKGQMVNVMGLPDAVAIEYLVRRASSQPGREKKDKFLSSPRRGSKYYRSSKLRTRNR